MISSRLLAAKLGIECDARVTATPAFAVVARNPRRDVPIGCALAFMDAYFVTVPRPKAKCHLGPGNRAALALAPKPPVTKAPTGRRNGPGLTCGTGYDALLRWAHPNPEPDLAGFVRLIRSTTAPDWECEIWAN